MTGHRGYLTLSGLLLSYALLLGLGWLVAESRGMWVAGAVATVLWLWAIARAVVAERSPGPRASTKDRKLS